MPSLRKSRKIFPMRNVSKMPPDEGRRSKVEDQKNESGDESPHSQFGVRKLISAFVFLTFDLLRLLELVLKYFLKLFDLGADHEAAVRLVGVQLVIALVIVFRGVELGEGRNLGHDRRPERA